MFHLPSTGEFFFQGHTSAAWSDRQPDEAEQYPPQSMTQSLPKTQPSYTAWRLRHQQSQR
jgi:hypothetical protein